MRYRLASFVSYFSTFVLFLYRFHAFTLRMFSMSLLLLFLLLTVCVCFALFLSLGVFNVSGVIDRWPLLFFVKGLRMRFFSFVFNLDMCTP